MALCELKPLHPERPPVHTPSTTLKSAALLALIGTGLLTIVVGVAFIVSLAGFLRGVVPVV